MSYIFQSKLLTNDERAARYALARQCGINSSWARKIRDFRPGTFDRFLVMTSQRQSDPNKEEVVMHLIEEYRDNLITA